MTAFWQRPAAERSGAGDVLAAARVDPNRFALLDEERDLDDLSGLQRRGLVAPARGGVAFEAGVGLGDLHLDRARHLHVARLLVDEEELDLVVRQHPLHRVPELLLGDFDLVVVLGVHEDRGVARVIEVLHLFRFGPHRAELLPRPEGFVDHRPVLDPPQLGADESAALARLDVLELDDPPDLPVDLDVGAVLELIRGDRHRRRILVAPRQAAPHGEVARRATASAWSRKTSPRTNLSPSRSQIQATGMSRMPRWRLRA